MELLKENEDFIYNFIQNDLRFYPSCDDDFSCHLPLIDRLWFMIFRK